MSNKNHLIRPLKDKSITLVLKRLEEVHDYIVKKAKQSHQGGMEDFDNWGCVMKRLVVDFDEKKPSLIGKRQEKFVEVINIVATLERLISALRWFKSNLTIKNYKVVVCHPSTSSGGNDLVIKETKGRETILCEVTDVVSSKCSSNGKEKKDLKSLGCDCKFKEGDTKRYICTSDEFSKALSGGRRHWNDKVYRYEIESIDDFEQSKTCMLLIRTNDNN